MSHGFWGSYWSLLVFPFGPLTLMAAVWILQAIFEAITERPNYRAESRNDEEERRNVYRNLVTTPAEEDRRRREAAKRKAIEDLNRIMKEE